MAKKEYSLREKKHAKTKIALSRAFLERLKSTRFSDIPIKEICSAVEISEGTFYNYFPNKIDLARYIEKIVLLKVAWHLHLKKEKLGPFEMIEYAFDLMAAEISQPFLFYEIISLFTSEKIKIKDAKVLSKVEKYFAFPQCPGIEEIKVTTLENLFLTLLNRAQKEGAVPKGAKIDDIIISLIALLVGVPLVIEIEDFKKLSTIFKTQLNLLWKALKN